MLTFCIVKIDASPVDLPTISPTQTNYWLDLSAVSAKNHPPVSFSYMYIYVCSYVYYYQFIIHIV